MENQNVYATDFRFLVVVGKVPESGNIGGKTTMHFSKVSGLEHDIEFEEIPEGGRNEGPHLCAAPHKKHPPLVLERGVIAGDSWLNQYRPGMRLGTPLTVLLLDALGKTTKWQFSIDDGIVAKWEVGGLDAMGNSVLVKKIEILHDGIRF